MAKKQVKTCHNCGNYESCRVAFHEVGALGLTAIGKKSKDQKKLHVALLKCIAKYCNEYK